MSNGFHRTIFIACLKTVKEEKTHFIMSLHYQHPPTNQTPLAMYFSSLVYASRPDRLDGTRSCQLSDSCGTQSTPRASKWLRSESNWYGGTRIRDFNTMSVLAQSYRFYLTRI